MAARKSYIEIGWRIDRSGLDEANRLTDGLTRAERSHREAVSQTTHNIDTQRHTISEVKSQTDTVAQAQERISSQAKRAATNTAEIGTAARSANGGVRGIDDSLGSAEKHSLRIRDIFKGTLIASAAYSGINMLGNGLKSLYQEANENAKAWQTFNGNLLMMGQSRKQIAATKADLQDFAVKTIYNASDMAQTYSQLSATGAKNTDKLVKGFAGLASSAQDPEQAMRSLSQQATQMAAMPKVQWQDLRIMMQQAPAGISAVARSMGESTGKMIQQVHAGKLSTQDFLAAIAKVGNDKNFQTMATHYKTADQALDGLRENLANQASPAFNRFNKIAVGALSDINNSLTGTAGKSFAKQMDPFYDGMEDFIKYMKQNGKYFFSIGGSLGSITKSLASGAWTALSGMINIIAGKGPGAGNSIKTIADSVKEIAKHKTEIQIIGGTLATFWAVKKASDFLGVVKQINGQLRISSRLSSVGNAMDDIHSYGKPAVTPTSKKVGSATYSYGGSYGNITKQIEQAGTTSGRHFAMEATKGGTKAGTTGGTKFASKVKTAGNSAGTSGGSRFAGKIQAAGRYAGSTGGGRFASRIRNSNWSKFGALVGASFGIEAFTGKTAKTRARGAGQGIGGAIAGALYGPEAAPIGAAVGGAIANTIIGLVDNWKPAQKGMQKNISKNEKQTGKSYNSNNQAWSNNGPSNLRGGLDGKASGGPITKTQLSAVNEAGTELAYNPSTGHFRTLGDGPAFTQLKAGERILKASDVSRMLHGGLGAGRTLPGYAAGTGSVTPATIGTTGIGSTKLNSTKDMSKSYSQETKKSTAALKKFNSDSKKTWKSTQSETSKVTRSISKRGVSDFDDMQKGVNTQMKQMNKQVGSGARDTAHDFGSAMGKLDNYAHSAMSSAIGQLNKGFSSVNGVLGQFGGSKHVLSLAHYAQGTNGPIDEDQLAVLNDAKSGPTQEGIVRGNQIIKPQGRNTIVPLQKNDEVLTGHELSSLPHYAKGTDGLKRIIENNNKAPQKAFQNDFASKLGQGIGSALSTGVSQNDKGGSTSVGNPWYGAVWNVLSDAMNSGGAGGPVTHSPGAGWGVTSGFGNRGAVSGGYSQHDGVDYSGGRTVHSMNTGTVQRVGGPPAGWGGGSGIGESVVIGGGGLNYIYQELNGKYGSGAKILVGKGDQVKAGQAIAVLGSSASHVHVGATHHPMFSIGGSSTAGWLDPRTIKSSAIKVKQDKDTGGSALNKFVKNQLAGQVKWVSKNLSEDDAGGSFGNPGGSGVSRWRGAVVKALKANGFSASASQVSAWLKVIARESNGNPTAVNNWDSNAKAGHPSKGLVQTIGPTFNAYKFPGHGNILNGYDDLLAGIHYAKSRYGKGPGMFARVSGPLGYAKGGHPTTGQTVMVGENGPELARFEQPATIYSNAASGQVAGNFAKADGKLGGRNVSIKLDVHVTGAVGDGKKAGKTIGDSVVDRLKTMFNTEADNVAVN